MKKATKILGYTVGMLIIIGMLVLFLLYAGILQDVFHTHKYGEWEVLVEPGCFDGGERQRSCECGYVEHEFTPSLGHEGTQDVVAATCVTGGYTSNHCVTCNKDFVNHLTAPLAHSYGEWEVQAAADCVSNGTESHVCATCGNIESRIVRAYGHKYDLVAESGGVFTYECSACSTCLESTDDIASLGRENDYIEDCSTSFSFDIECLGDEAYIRENLKIFDAYFKGSENAPVTADDDSVTTVFVDYSLESLGDGTWRVTPSSAYEYDTAYAVTLGDGVAFSEFSGDEVVFKTEDDPNHQSSFKYSDDIIFIKDLDEKAPGYYPFNIITPGSNNAESEHIFVTLGKIDGIAVGSLICLGDATGTHNITEAEEVIIAKVSAMMPYDDDSYMLVLEAPTLAEVFDVLDVSESGIITFEEQEQITAALSDELVDMLWSDPDFVAFVASVNLAAEDYLTERDMDITYLSTKSFVDNIKITPNVSFEDSTLLASMSGKMEVPIKNKSGKSFGKIEVSFEFSVSAQFEFDVDYGLKKFLGIPTGLDYFDVSITQTDTVGFNFDIKIEMDYSLSDKEDLFVQNTESGLVHCKDCLYVTRIKDKSKIKTITETEMYQLIKTPGSRACTICKPDVKLDRSAFMLNMATEEFHCINCKHADNILEKNQSVQLYRTAQQIIDEGYSPCAWCQPEKKDAADFEKELLNAPENADWKAKVEQIKSTLDKSDSAPTGSTTRKLTSHSIAIFQVIIVRFDVNFVLDFHLEASVDYDFEYKKTNTYGMRLTDSGVESRHYESKPEFKSDLTVMGKAMVRVGIALDINVHPLGLEDSIHADLNAGIGVYAKLTGILHMTLDPSVNNYYAAKFEAGIYIEITASYKAFKWSGSVDIIDKEYPILVLGYSRAYFAYSEYRESIEFRDDYNLMEQELLKVKYFDLDYDKMSECDGELALSGENGKYSVSFTLEDGTYLDIVDGVIVVKENAPCNFTDKLIISVSGAASWKSCVKDSAVYYLDDYVIELVYNRGEHDNEQTDYLAPTCTVAGHEELTCKLCGYVTLIELEETGHRQGDDAFELVEATCTKDGYERYYCADCGLESVKPLPATGHSGGTATCTLPASCEVCSTPYGEPLGHEYQDITCSRCGALKPSEGLVFELSDDGTHYILTEAQACEDATIIVPDTYAGLPVTEIGDGALGALYATRIVLPETITSIGEGAFMFSVALVQVNIPDGVTYIGEGAFLLCMALQTVELPEGITTIGASMFGGCESLRSINIPAGVTTIGESAFERCLSLCEITIPESVMSIDECAFNECSSLTSVTFEDPSQWYSVSSYGTEEAVDFSIPAQNAAVLVAANENQLKFVKKEG